MGSYHNHLREESFFNKNSLKLTGELLVVSISILALFLKDFIDVFRNAFLSIFTLYVFVVPLLFTYNLYRRRHVLKIVLNPNSLNQVTRPKYLSSITGAFLILISVFLYWNGSYTVLSLEYHLIAFPIYSAGIVLFLFKLHVVMKLIN